jgi:hypothetical protein
VQGRMGAPLPTRWHTRCLLDDHKIGNSRSTPATGDHDRQNRDMSCNHAAHVTIPLILNNCCPRGRNGGHSRLRGTRREWFSSRTGVPPASGTATRATTLFGELRHEALCRIPRGLRRNREEHSWVRWLTWTRNGSRPSTGRGATAGCGRSPEGRLQPGADRRDRQGPYPHDLTATGSRAPRTARHARIRAWPAAPGGSRGPARP